MSRGFFSLLLGLKISKQVIKFISLSFFTRKALAMGASEHWSEALFVITGEREIKSDALLEYYQPLDNFLESLILKYNIPYGWLGPV